MLPPNVGNLFEAIARSIIVLQSHRAHLPVKQANVGFGAWIQPVEATD
jgi:hypothetical protein